jgi:hypothetical protein
MNPPAAAIHTPAGFIADNSRRASHLLSNPLVRRPEFRRQPPLSLPVGTPRDFETKQLFDQPPTLAVREAQFFIRNRQRRLQVRPELTGRRSQSVRRLQRMPSLNTFAATGAVTDVNVKLAIDRLAGNVRLVLLADGVFGQFATPALWTALRQRSLPALINLLGDGSSSLRPIIVTRLTPWLSRDNYLRLAERSRLTLARTLRFFERCPQLLDLLFQLLKLLRELPVTAAVRLLSGVCIHDRRKLNRPGKMRNPTIAVNIYRDTS